MSATLGEFPSICLPPLPQVLALKGPLPSSSIVNACVCVSKRRLQWHFYWVQSIEGECLWHHRKNCKILASQTVTHMHSVPSPGACKLRACLLVLLLCLLHCALIHSSLMITALVSYYRNAVNGPVSVRSMPEDIWASEVVFHRLHRYSCGGGYQMFVPYGFQLRSPWFVCRQQENVIYSYY